MDLVLPEKRICEGRRPEAYPFFRIFPPFPKLFLGRGDKGGLGEQLHITRGWVTSVPSRKKSNLEVSMPGIE